MMIAGGQGQHVWTITTTDKHASSGRVIRRVVTLDAPTHLPMTARQASRLATALHHAARHKGDSDGI
jgi:hypothetical protein